MNLNELAVEISKLEGGKVNLTVAQIIEVVGCYHEVVVAKMHDQGTLERAQEWSHDHLNLMVSNGLERQRLKVQL